MKKRKRKAFVLHRKLPFGFSLIELLVVVAILSVLLIIAAVSYQQQRIKGYDARRKSDLSNLKNVLEDYFNDRSCYPAEAVLQSCNSSALDPYMAKVPCDPQTKQPYGYLVDPYCKWYSLFTTLQNSYDPVIEESGCSPTCGVSGQTYNYYVSNGSMTLADMTGNNPTPTPTGGGGGGGGGGGSGGGVGQYACDPTGQCNVYSDPVEKGCPVTFFDPTACQQACANSVNRCSQ